MKKLLLTALMAIPFGLFAQGPGNIGLPAIWLKADAGLTKDGLNNVTGWTNQGSIPFTLSPWLTAPTSNGAVVTFAANQALKFVQVGTELSDVLGDGIASKRYEVFLVATGSTSGALLYMGPNNPYTDAVSLQMNHVTFGKRAVYFNSNDTGGGDGDGEVGYYDGDGATNKAYAPNVPANSIPSELTISNIMSHSYNPYIDLNSLIFNINGIGAVKKPDGTGSSGGNDNYAGKGQTYSSGGSNKKYDLAQVSSIILGGVLKADGTGLRRVAPGNYYEIIVYPRRLTIEERQKVYSYLSVKYNVYLAHDQGAYTGAATIGNAVGNGETVTNGTLFASDGTTVIYRRDNYNYTNDQDYKGNAATGFVKDTFYLLNGNNTNNSIQRFGRDDASTLNVFAAPYMNSTYFERSPKSTMPSDKQFMTLTVNRTDAFAYTTDNSGNTTYPTDLGLAGRINRTWKLTTTGYDGKFKITSGMGSVISAEGLTKFNTVLLVSADPSFPNGLTTYKTLANVDANWVYWDNNASEIFGAVAAGEYKTMYVALAKLITPLPVELNSFTAKSQQNGVVLNWITNTESNSSHFNVTRSADGKQFNTIGRVEAAGNSAAVKNYSFTDPNPLAGTNYYQLQQIDLDGGSNPSNIVSANYGLARASIRVEKITANEIVLSVVGISKGQGTISASNALGQVLSQQAVDFGQATIRIKVGAAKGLIILTLNSAEGKLSKKIIK